jgi:hypothetical protein
MPPDSGEIVIADPFISQLRKTLCRRSASVPAAQAAQRRKVSLIPVFGGAGGVEEDGCGDGEAEELPRAKGAEVVKRGD